MGGAGTSPPPRRPAATRGAVGARGAYVTCQVSIQVCFEIYSRYENLDVRFQWGGARPDLRIAPLPSRRVAQTEQRPRQRSLLRPSVARGHILARFCRAQAPRGCVATPAVYAASLAFISPCTLSAEAGVQLRQSIKI